ncbi:MAG: molybdate ABC transporter permease subunit, partial [Planctomycetes bacterium]|nr:molybdate ABC transporter permease subunit [Planctomycetota bacterium]
MTDAEWEIVFLTLKVAGLSVALSIVPGVLLGWLLARWESPWRTVLQGVTMLPLVMPPVVTGYLLLKILGRRGPLGQAWESITGGSIAYTTGAAVIAASVVGFPLLVEAVRISILGVNPKLEQVSRSLGRGKSYTFLRVTLPLSIAGVIGGAVLSFARALGEFGATIVLAGNTTGETQTIPLAVYSLMNSTDGDAAAMRLVGVSV